VFSARSSPMAVHATMAQQQRNSFFLTPPKCSVFLFSLAATEKRCFLCGPRQDFISRTVSESELSEVKNILLLSECVSYSRVAVAEARGHFRNTKEGERPPLEAVTRKRVKTQQGEKT
jgi:hypothetical protein